MRIRKILAISVIVLLGGIILWGCRNRENVSSQENSLSEEVCEIAIENMTLGAAYPDTEEVEKMINEITVPAISCKVKIVNCYIGDHANMLKKSRMGIQQLDLVNTGTTTSLSELVSEGALLELNDLLENYGQDLEKKEGNLLDVTSINGKIYAVCANLNPGRASGVGYNNDIAKKYDIQVSDQLTLDDLTEIGRQLKEKNTGIYLTSFGNLGNVESSAFTSLFDVEDFGGDMNYGVIFHPLDSTEIVNAYASEEYRDFCRIMKLWRDEGYIPKDSLYSGVDAQSMFNTGEMFLQWTSVSQGTLHLIGKKNLSFDEVLVAMTPNRITTSLVQEFTWGISSSCKKPEKAMELLNLIYTNSQLANLLQNGREGIDYVKTGEKTIRYPENKDNSNVGYSSYFSSFGDGEMVYQFGDSDTDWHNYIKNYSEDSSPSKTLGYVFQTDSVAEEVENVSRIVNKYRPVLETGMTQDADETLDQFLAELEAAGMEQIIKENRQQLKAWLEK